MVLLIKLVMRSLKAVMYFTSEDVMILCHESSTTERTSLKF